MLNALHELRREKSGLEQENNSLRHALEASRREATATQSTASSLAASRDQLQRALNATSSKKVEADEKLLSALHAENGQLQLKVQQAQAEAASLRSRLFGYEK